MASAADEKNTQKDQPGGKPKTLNVTVTFPLASKPPYKDDDAAPETTLGAVRAAAMTHFGVADDQSTVFYLTHHGDRPGADLTLGDLADEARAVKLTLAKELIQG